MKITVGRTIHYTLTEDDAAKINRRRTTGASIAERIKKFFVHIYTHDESEPHQRTAPYWPLGAQAHIGNEAKEGDMLPLIVTRVHPMPEMADQTVNGQVILDGNDTLFVEKVRESPFMDSKGTWHFPERV